MTMPLERRRSLRWARQTLQDVAVDAGAGQDLKASIQVLLQTFPDDRAVVTCFLELDEGAVQLDLEAIRQAELLLRQALMEGGLTSTTGWAVRATLRHFPQGWELPCKGTPLQGRAWVWFHLLSDLRVEDWRAELKELGVEAPEAAIEGFRSLMGGRTVDGAWGWRPATASDSRCSRED